MYHAVCMRARGAGMGGPEGLVQNMDSGLWTGLWTEIWTGFWTDTQFNDDHFQP